MFRTVLRALVAVGVVATAATTAGCGDSVDKTQACEGIQQEIQNLVQNVSAQANDPDALSKTIRESAEKIRDQGAAAGGDVEQAADDTANALEQAADRVDEGTSQESDLTPLVNASQEAGKKIREACGPAA